MGNNKKDNPDPRYTFDTFIVGGSNRFAYMAARAVAEDKVGYYNPTTRYSKTGFQ